MSGWLLIVVQQIAAFGINKGFEKLFLSREDFANRLYKIVSLTIDDFEKKFPVPDQNGKFAFYKSPEIVEEFLKYRLFAKHHYSLNRKNIQHALELNPKILKPTENEIENFFQIFDDYIQKDDKLKSLEIEDGYKETIFEIYDIVVKSLNLLEDHLVEIVPLLDEEYKEEINIYIEEIRGLKPQSSLKHLIGLEERVNRNSKHVSSRVKANLIYFKGVCYEALGQSSEAYESFIKAYRLLPENKQYLEKACISFYYLKNIEYKELKSSIEKIDSFNSISWAIDTIESKNLIDFIEKSVGDNIINKNYYKRLVFNKVLKDGGADLLNLIEALEVSGVTQDYPKSINYDNLHHWIFILNTLSITYFNAFELPYWSYLEKDERNLQLLEISKLLANAVKESELDENYNSIVFMHYWFLSELEKKPDTIPNLTEAYKSLKEKDSFKTLLYANSLQKREGTEAALNVLKDFKGELDENLIALKTFCLMENPQSADVVFEYFKYINQMDEYNAQNICSFLHSTTKSNLIEKSSLVEIMRKMSFSKPGYKDLVFLLIEINYSREDPIDIKDINSLRKKLESDSKLYFYISLLYYENKYFDECVIYQDSYLDKEKESRDLLLYIRALNSSKESSQVALLKLLKKWRTSFSFDDYLLRIEIELRQILKDWDELLLICEYGLQNMPHDEAFFTLYIISLSETKKVDQIKQELKRIEQFNFVITENALRVAGIIIQLNHLNEGIEIIYKKAVNRNDSLARINYFYLTTNFPGEYFKDLDNVAEDCFVKYQIDNEDETIHINEQTIELPIVQNSIGKKVSDAFSIENPISRAIRKVKILRIMNKYLALFDDIQSEANSSFSNLPLESIKFESNDIKGLEKALIENFGGAQEESRKHKENTINDYYAYKVSFTELVSSNFEGSFIDGYYTLISNQSNGYLLKPIKYFNAGINFEDKSIILDFTSGLLFYELSDKLDLEFENFVISKNLYSLIDQQIAKTENFRNSNMSVTLSRNRIVPHIYPEDFHDKRVEFLIKLKEWFSDNSSAEIPEEKIEVIRPLYNEGKPTRELEYIIDNAFLAQRENYMLVTDDMIYETKLRINNWVTTEKYLLNRFPTKKNEILQILLAFRYVGASINSDVLYSTYLEHFKEGNSYVYYYALRNLSLPVNLSSFNIFTAVDFLKKIALNSTISYEKYNFDATNLLSMLVSSFPNPSFLLTLKTKIDQQFHLMGEYHNLTLNALLNAINISELK